LSYDCGFSLPLHNSPLYSSVHIHAALEVVDPGGSLSTLLSPCLNGEMPGQPGRRQRRWRHTVAAVGWWLFSFGCRQSVAAAWLWQSSYGTKFLICNFHISYLLFLSCSILLAHFI
jgi:hypothetical protein